MRPGLCRSIALKGSSTSSQSIYFNYFDALALSKKGKKNDFSDLIRYMHLLDAAQLKVLRSKYLQEGPVGLEKGTNIKADFV